ncbi:A/G-specific adenine glycosylase [Gaoshiqia sp. Z1-71]|uniref:A/G-specific adenine glycosylase n=1 Tax=Gaoshiqia hydrogeniformans TaxID=3290090 RepID=UPI003BF7A036
MKNPLDFGPDLLRWYKQNKRPLPWRETRDPYRVWLSEIIMQQTRIDQGLAYYRKFVENFPALTDFAMADEDTILKLWQGLGYYSRARNMHHTAKTIAANHEGIFPDNYTALLKLKGIGEYTAAAIASIAFKQPHAAVDGNVYRVLSRLYGIDTPVDSSQGKKEFRELANRLLDRKNPGDHNQALMEFGALLCTPRNPDCPDCPFKNRCVAHQSGLTDKLPAKAGKQKIRLRYFNYLLICSGDDIYLNKRTGNDIWKNLYEFPLIEHDRKTEPAELGPQLNSLFGLQQIVVTKITAWKKQVLSHQHIYYRFLYISDGDKKIELSAFVKVNKKDIFNFAVPKPVEKEIENLNL